MKMNIVKINIVMMPYGGIYHTETFNDAQNAISYIKDNNPYNEGIVKIFVDLVDNDNDYFIEPATTTEEMGFYELQELSEKISI